MHFYRISCGGRHNFKGTIEGRGGEHLFYLICLNTNNIVLKDLKKNTLKVSLPEEKIFFSKVNST